MGILVQNPGLKRPGFAFHAIILGMHIYATQRKIPTHCKRAKEPVADKGNGFSNRENRQLASLGLNPTTLKCLHRKQVQFTNEQAQYCLALLSKQNPQLKLPENFYKDKKALNLLSQAGLINPGDKNRLEKDIDKILRQLCEDRNLELSFQARQALSFFSRRSLDSSSGALKLIGQKQLPAETRILIELKEAQKERSSKAKNQKSTKGGTCKTFRQHTSRPRVATKLAAVRVPSLHSDKTTGARTFRVVPVSLWDGKRSIPVTSWLTPRRGRPVISERLHLDDWWDDVPAASTANAKTETGSETENYWWCSIAEQLNAKAEQALACAPWLTAFNRITTPPSPA